MGIGRLEFLRLTGLALTGLAMDPLQAVVIHDDAYVNRKFGILFHKPHNWGFIAAKDFGKLKSAQKIGEGLDMTQDEIWNDLGDPVCVATKYYEDLPEYKGVFSPTITLQITPKTEIEGGFESLEELIEMSHFGVAALLKDFRLVKAYEPYYISNCRFYEFDAVYKFEHEEIDKPLMVELKTLKAEHNGFYYDFNCHQSKEQGQTAEEEFQEFKKSIKLI